MKVLGRCMDDDSKILYPGRSSFRIRVKAKISSDRDSETTNRYISEKNTMNPEGNPG